MITREVDYAIRAMLCLAVHEEDSVVSTTMMSQEMDIPYRFLRRILLRLVNAGLVTSTRGKQGGLRLARPAAEISLREVVLALDPPAFALNACLLDRTSCHRTAYCVVHEELARVQAVMDAHLAEITLAALAARERARDLRAPSPPAPLPGGEGSDGAGSRS